ncbi:MAG: putative zinc-binding metallopeptidase [Chitinispirillaceae bacterium]|nr:putative zinc-binding metallopeptidase [Chitinispirillaceae bacterium]
MAKSDTKRKLIVVDELSEEELLRVRIRDLHLSIEGSILEERIARLYRELDEKGILFRPPCYLTDEWLAPDGIPMVGIPFYLVHPRLTHLEKKMMLEAEGDTDAWCMQLLRHETGHAINYAYRLYRRSRWRELFGPFTTPYLSTYSAQPYSRRYVVHLEDNYAQAHPDEDFAETFAVWLAPGRAWEEKYRGWPAMKKLLYVDHLMSCVGKKPPEISTQRMLWSATRMRSTLKEYYERKRHSLRDDFHGYYDPGLLRIFTVRSGTEQHKKSAAHFLSIHRRHIINSVSMWTMQRKFDIDKLVTRLRQRCADLGLSVYKSDAETMFETASFITAVMGKLQRFDWKSEG